MTIIRFADLLLRPVRPDDAARFTLLCNDALIAWNTARIPHPYSREDADAFVAYCKNAKNNEDVFAVCRDGEIIACAGASKIAPGTAELGYWVGDGYRGGGVATRAATAVCQFAVKKRAVSRLTAGYFTDNPASGRVLERIGFRKTGETAMLYSAGRKGEVETVRMAMPRNGFTLRDDIVIEASAF